MIYKSFTPSRYPFENIVAGEVVRIQAEHPMSSKKNDR
jgi:hypothetical protein